MTEKSPQVLAKDYRRKEAHFTTLWVAASGSKGHVAIKPDDLKAVADMMGALAALYDEMSAPPPPQPSRMRRFAKGALKGAIEGAVMLFFVVGYLVLAEIYL